MDWFPVAFNKAIDFEMSNPVEGAPSAQANFTPMLMSPFMPGSMCGQRFKGKHSDISLTEWIETLNTMFRMYRIPDTLQVDFVLSHLEGETKRQILVVAAGERDTTEKVFKRLKSLYGDKMSASVLRSLCFSCRQELTETVPDFSLRLQELFKKLKEKDAGGIPNMDAMMRDQFVHGLQDKVLKRELRTLTVSSPSLSFIDVYKEASIRLEITGEVACDAVGHLTNALTAPVDLEQLKKELRGEMVAEIQKKMASLTKGIVSELREEFNLAPRGATGHNFQPYDYQRERRPSLPTSSYPARESFRPRAQHLHQYTSDGRPVCSKCQQPGHMQRHCNQRERSNSVGSRPLN